MTTEETKFFQLRCISFVCDSGYLYLNVISAYDLNRC